MMDEDNGNLPWKRERETNSVELSDSNRGGYAANTCRTNGSTRQSSIKDGLTRGSVQQQGRGKSDKTGCLACALPKTLVQDSQVCLKQFAPREGVI